MLASVDGRVMPGNARQDVKTPWPRLAKPSGRVTLASEVQAEKA